MSDTPKPSTVQFKMTETFRLMLAGKPTPAPGTHRTPAQILETLVNDAEWYVSAIELGQSQNGEQLKIEAIAALRAALTPPPTDPPGIVALVQEWQAAHHDLDARMAVEESPDHDQAAENALHAAHRRDEAAIKALLAWTPAAPSEPPAGRSPR